MASDSVDAYNAAAFFVNVPGNSRCGEIEAALAKLVILLVPLSLY